VVEGWGLGVGGLRFGILYAGLGVGHWAMGVRDWTAPRSHCVQQCAHLPAAKRCRFVVSSLWFVVSGRL